MVYETRKAAAAACIYEANAAKHYSKVAIEYAQRGECRRAWDMADRMKSSTPSRKRRSRRRTRPKRNALQRLR